MAVGGNIYVGVIARTKRFHEPMKNVRKDMKRTATFSQRLRAGVNKLGPAFTRMGIAATAAAGALGYLVKKQMTVIDRIGKVSKQIGISTEELSQLQHAAQLSGVETERFVKGLQTLQKRVGQTTMVLGEGARALEMVGISAKKFQTLDTAKQFRVAADAIAKLKTSAEQAAVANDLFGRSGIELLPMLQQGGAAIKRMQEEADRLGLTVGEDMAKKVQDANDAITNMKAAAGGFVRTLAGQLSPSIKVAADYLTAMVVQQRNAISSTNDLKQDFSGLARVLAITADYFSAINILITDTQLNLAEWKLWKLEWEKFMTPEKFAAKTGLTDQLEKQREMVKGLRQDVLDLMLPLTYLQKLEAQLRKAGPDTVPVTPEITPDWGDDLTKDLEKAFERTDPGWHRLFDNVFENASRDIFNWDTAETIFGSFTKSLDQIMNPQALTKGSRAAYSKILELQDRGVGKAAEKPSALGSIGGAVAGAGKSLMPDTGIIGPATFKHFWGQVWKSMKDVKPPAWEPPALAAPDEIDFENIFQTPRGTSAASPDFLHFSKNSDTQTGLLADIRDGNQKLIDNFNFATV